MLYCDKCQKIAFQTKELCIGVIFYLFNSLKALDLVTMKRLDSKVNIIPVIAKADTITKTELQKFKSKVSFHLITCSFVMY